MIDTRWQHLVVDDTVLITAVFDECILQLQLCPLLWEDAEDDVEDTDEDDDDVDTVDQGGSHHQSLHHLK